MEYLLKWSHRNRFVVLQCQFIKRFDSSHCTQFKRVLAEWQRQDEMEADYDIPSVNNNPMTPLIGILFDEDYNLIEYPFEHPLYPYNALASKTFPHFSCDYALYKVLHLKSASPPLQENPYRFIPLSANTMLNTGNQFVYGETLMWVSIPRVTERVAVNKEKLLRGKAVDTYDVPLDIATHIKGFLGGK